ncbi:Dual-specificity kinase, spindle pole body (SPB) duplication and spindle checkpoint function [Linnemannia gamsii]|uniref:Dual-specificity kinase, spindle pole body (SPB) duplication and spindle checkpoint function n=1 Tax=Linnemannia gamsii TaxID=64522 RepID=A0ABQ7JWW8_9FUNG|nr:Dual-specificity kinase, spindle pole body (SPB) duplication and spindle checkpoint function [Linnemannia gamsii]
MPSTDVDKPALTESMSTTTSEPKVVFAPPPSRISRNPEGKENLTPRTSLTTRSYLRKSIPTKSTAPRKSLNWGLPQRDVTESVEQEESKGSASNNNEDPMPLTDEQNIDTPAQPAAVTAGATVPSTADDSGTSSVDLALQDLQVDDAAAGSSGSSGSSGPSGSSGSSGPSGSNLGLVQGRQGIKRDMDEAVSSIKRRKEFHPQADTSRLAIKRTRDMGHRTVMMVNNRPYTRLTQVGKGGSSKVYKVLASNSRVLALKKVSFDNADQVMEFGEIDLAHMLLNQQSQPFDIHFIGLYWRQMLEAVQVVHDLKIVHSDLKPANFMLVEGSLKLIDFGIANAIANDTTNVHREGQLGTANYMSPEAISSNPTVGCRKLGKPSDVWSLGCILYQMVYGRSPFSDIANVFQKLAVISNPNYQINFPLTIRSPLLTRKAQLNPLPPATSQAQSASGAGAGAGVAGDGAITVATTLGTDNASNTGAASSPLPESAQVVPTTVGIDPNLIRVMKGCLAHKVANRMTIPELLADPFLHPYKSTPAASSSSSANLGLGLSGAGAGTEAGSGGPVMMDVDTLQQVMQASMVFAASQVTSNSNGSSPSLTGGAEVIDKEVVKSATEQVWRQLQAKMKSGSTGGNFFISD